MQDLDQMTRLYTAFPNFAAMLDAVGGYRPTLRAYGAWETEEHRAALRALADAYDAAQDARGDPRRAVRADLDPPPTPRPGRRPRQRARVPSPAHAQD